MSIKSGFNRVAKRIGKPLNGVIALAEGIAGWSLLVVTLPVAAAAAFTAFACPILIPLAIAAPMATLMGGSILMANASHRINGTEKSNKKNKDEKKKYKKNNYKGPIFSPSKPLY